MARAFDCNNLQRISQIPIDQPLKEVLFGSKHLKNIYLNNVRCPPILNPCPAVAFSRRRPDGVFSFYFSRLSSQAPFAQTSAIRIRTPWLSDGFSQSMRFKIR